MTWVLVGATTLALWCLIGGAVRPLYVQLNGMTSTTDAAAIQPDYTGWILGLGALVAFLALPGGGIWVACVAVVVWVARWFIKREAYERQRLYGREQVLRGCGVLSGQLAIGELPATAIRVTAAEAELFTRVAAAVDVGGDPVDSFRSLARLPGCAALTQLADAWQVCLHTGMPLRDTVQAVVTNVENEAERESIREAELASARTTGRMLAALPLVGLLMGFAVGADPLTFITSSTFGQLCLLGACALAGFGLMWTERLGDAERSLVTITAATGGRARSWLAGLLSRGRAATAQTQNDISPAERAAEQVGFAPALDLLAAVLHSGVSLRSATATVSSVASGPVGHRLREVTALTDIGFGDAAAWRSLQDHHLWGEVARQVAHSADSGAGLGMILRRSADRHRDRLAAELMVQARRVGAKSALPLVSCYLPAFLLVGVLPIIGSLAGQYLG